MSIEQDDLDLLLSLQDNRVLETPPASPSHTHPPGVQIDYLSDHESPRRQQRCMGRADMSVFKESVGDYLEVIPNKKPKLNHSKRSSNDICVERFSGLRIRNPSASTEELNFSETRFIRLPAIRNSLIGNTISGCWATAGVLTENGISRLSSNGKKYNIWKLGCLDENVVSVFLFGDAYTNNCKEAAGAVFALFNAKVRKDAKGNGISLSVFSSDQISKMGTSADYGVCKGKRKDGVACDMVINKCQGIYCNYHKSSASQKYSVTRTELKGGNLRTSFRDTHRPEGIYMVKPQSERTNFNNSKQPMKLLSVDGLKKALSNASKVTTNARSQGIRFLTEVTGNMHPKDPSKGSTLPHKDIHRSEERLPSSRVHNKQSEAKRRKTTQPAEKMIEIDVFSSEEE